MTDPKSQIQPASKTEKDALREGMEARKAGKPRKSPYAGIELLRAAHAAWLKGWESGR